MEFTTWYCPHPQCTHDGQRGFDAHLVRCKPPQSMLDAYAE